MEKLLKIAQKFMKDNYGINELELSDGINKIRMVRNSPAITCWTTWPYQYSYQIPQY